MLTSMLLLLTWPSALAQTSGEYQIGPGDVVEITVHGQDFGRKEYVVGESGDVSFPYVGVIHLGGATVFKAEDTIEAALQDGYLVQPQVTLQVVEYRSQRVDVLGAVDKPGLQYLTRPTTVREAISAAGGPKLEDNTGQLVHTRNGQSTVLALTDIHGKAGEILLAPGDIVEIRKGRYIYMAGEVNKPGAMSFTEGITAAQALTKAGGASDFGRLAGSYVLRDGERISINLRKILKGKQADVAL